MHSSPDGTPWQRVVNAQGKCSTGKIVLPHDKQQRLLELEGVAFDKNGRCDLEQFLFIPKTRSQKPKGASLFKTKAGGEKR
jgi:methylated-DNA-protein-cysteine methyltransferase-like protein